MTSILYDWINNFIRHHGVEQVSIWIVCVRTSLFVHFALVGRIVKAVNAAHKCAPITVCPLVVGSHVLHKKKLPKDGLKKRAMFCFYWSVLVFIERYPQKVSQYPPRMPQNLGWFKPLLCCQMPPLFPRQPLRNSSIIRSEIYFFLRLPHWIKEKRSLTTSGNVQSFFHSGAKGRLFPRFSEFGRKKRNYAKAFNWCTFLKSQHFLYL